MRVLLIPAALARPIAERELPTADVLQLRAIQEAVGGHFEAVLWPGRTDEVVLVNEDGQRRRLPYNRRASRILGRTYGEILGDVLVAGRMGVELTDTSFSAAELEAW